jgi:hypothetical protein
MPEEKHSYRGSEIIIRTEGDSEELFIDGQHVKVDAVATDSFWTPTTPYVKYSSVLDLAKAVIDHRLK